MKKCPSNIADERVLLYAIIDESVMFSGRTLLFVDGVEMGRVPALATCEEHSSGGVLLVHCDEEWNPLGCSAHDSVESARQRTTQIYPNIEAHWNRPEHTSEQ